MVFYVVTGYKFQPAVDNPYLPVSSEENNLYNNEYGLDDADDLDLSMDIELVGSLRNSSASSSLKKQQSKNSIVVNTSGINAL